MQLLIDAQNKRAYKSLYSNEPASIADFEHGETVPVSVALVDQITNPTGSRIWEPRDTTGWAFRIGLGNGFVQPVAGTFTLTYGANTTTALPYNATAAQISTALGLLASIVSAGGISVSGEAGFFYFTFTTAGSRTVISGDNTNLAPLTILDFGTLIDGTSTLQEVQLLRIAQNPGAYLSLSDSVATPGITLTVLDGGGSGHNCRVRVTLSPLPFDGVWTFSTTSVESGLIGFDDDASTVQEIIEGTSTVGSGNVEVIKEQGGSYLIAFKGTLANTAMSGFAINGTALRVVPFMSGTLDLRTSGIDILLGGASSETVTLEIEGNSSGGTNQKLYRQTAALLSSIINPSNQSTALLDSVLSTNMSVWFASLPTSSPGGGMPWNNGGVLDFS